MGTISLPEVKARKTWWTGVVASILAIAFGVPWILLHVAAFGASSLADSPDTSLPKSFSGLTGNHTDCQACNLLNEQQEKNDDPLSTITPDLVKFECIADRCMPALEVNGFYHTQILSPCSLSRPPSPFLRKKPPKSTA